VGGSASAALVDKIVFAGDRAGNYGICIMNPNGSDVHALTSEASDDRCPAISPQGDKIAFSSDRGGDNESYVMNADGSNVRQVTDDGFDSSWPRWSPDGAKLVYATEYSMDDSYIWGINVDGTSATCLGGDLGYNDCPSYKLDGSRIIFDCFDPTVGASHDLYVMNPDGSGATYLTDSSDIDEGSPAWSPDGSQVAYSAGAVGTETTNIYLLSPNTQLTTLDGRAGAPAWSPDGTKIALMYKEPGKKATWHIYTMNADGSNLLKLTGTWGSYNHMCPFWGKVWEAELEWAGTSGYEADGVDPDTGDPTSTTFTFKVKYTDHSGEPPKLARCLIRRKDCGDAWRPCRSLALTRESGDIATGAIYSGSMALANLVYKYRFLFKDSTKADVAGDPAGFQPGPAITGRPWVCWTGATGFEADGVDPESGPLGTSFKFQVQYADSAGDPPTLSQLVIRRNGRIFRQKPMSAAPAGDLRLGKVYRTTVILDKLGTYEYRYNFADASGSALGPPNQWSNGPTITGTSGVGVTSLAAIPTAAGQQLTFVLSSRAQVEARVLNIAGRTVATLCRSRDCEARRNVLVWNTCSDSGLEAPAGTYVVLVTAHADDGTQASAATTLRLSRAAGVR